MSELTGKKVLVTGATGFTGTYLLYALVAQGALVHCIARPSPRADKLRQMPGVTVFEGQVYDPEVVTRAAKGVEFVFHVAAAFRDASVEQEEYYRVHVASTELLLKEVAKNPLFRRFVLVSTMGVHGHIEHPPGSETSPYAPGDEYQRTKLQAEDYVRTFCLKHPIDYTIIRPTGIYGPGDRRLLKVFRLALLPATPILGFGQTLYHYVYVTDLVDAILLSATAPSASREAFIIGDERAIALPTVLSEIRRIFRKKGCNTRIPVTPFFWLAALCEAFAKATKTSPILYKRRVAYFTKDRSFDTSKMRDTLGFTPKVGTLEGIRRTAEWYVQQGWLQAPPASEAGGSNQASPPQDAHVANK